MKYKVLALYKSNLLLLLVIFISYYYYLLLLLLFISLSLLLTVEPGEVYPHINYSVLMIQQIQEI